MLIDYGNTTVSPDWALNEPVAVGYSRVYYIYSGDVLYEDACGCTALLPGHLYVLPTTVAYRCRRQSMKPFSCTYLHVDYLYAQITGIIDLDVPENTSLYHYCSMLHDVIAEGRIDILESMLEALTLFLRGNDRFHPTSGMVTEVSRYISAHLSGPVSVEDLSQLFSYHPNYFIRLFYQETHYTPHQFILRMRMQYAVSLLHKGLSVAEITELSGFSSPSTFTRAFRTYYGVTPREYRVRERI